MRRSARFPPDVVRDYNELVSSACLILKRNAAIVVSCAAQAAEPSRRMGKVPIDFVLRRRRWIEADVRGSSHVGID